jgi:3-oxoadipate enol-lactonase
VREFWFENDGVRLFGVEDGEGPVIIMLHGGMANHLTALPLISPLGARYRVIAPDLRGSGRSWSPGPLTFDRLADDVRALLDHIGVDRAVVGGVSGGSGVALRFAFQHPDRIAGLVLVKPIYGGEECGYTEQQKEAFAMMDAIASRTIDEGVQVLRPLYANLPPPMREKALAMIEGFDAASVEATSHFLASGAQPFTSPAELQSLQIPTLLSMGDDPIHPAEISELNAANLPNCTIIPASTNDLASAINTFYEQNIRA